MDTAMNQENDTAAASSTTNSASSSVRSPGLNHFRRNPFRLLRLALDTTAQEVVWKAEKAMALARAGLPPTEPDALPWLADADEVDLQQASHGLEEPMRRLIDQLCWFDFATDPVGQRLQAALSEANVSGLVELLGLPDPVKPAVAEPTEEQLAAAGGELPTATATEECLPRIARRINQANLHLVLGFSALHGLGPRLPATATRGNLPLEGRPGDRKAAGKDHARPALPWRRAGGAQLLDDVHALVGDGDRDDQQWPALLGSGLRRWSELLEDSEFSYAVRHQIRRLGDELLSDEDEEPVVSAVRTRLADLVAGEVKLAMVGGDPDTVTGLATVAAGSGLDPQVWVLSFRPLRYLFDSELGELDSLLVESAGADLGNADLFLKRLEALKQRWQHVDAGGVLGLNEIIDEAVARAFDRLRNIHDTTTDHALRYPEALRRAATITGSASLKERINAFIETFKGYREHAICAFCHQREMDPEVPIVITGQRVTRVEPTYNGTITHYNLRAAPVPRCLPCADFHDLQREVGSWAWVSVAPFPFIAAWALDLDGGGFFGMLLLAVLLGAVVMWGAKWALRRQAGSFSMAFNPHHHSSVTDLRAEGYTITKVNFRKNAMSTWQTSAKASGGGGGGMSGANAARLIIFGIFILIALARACK